MYSQKVQARPGNGRNVQHSRLLQGGHALADQDHRQHRHQRRADRKEASDRQFGRGAQHDPGNDAEQDDTQPQPGQQVDAGALGPERGIEQHRFEDFPVDRDEGQHEQHDGRLPVQCGRQLVLDVGLPAPGQAFLVHPDPYAEQHDGRKQRGIAFGHLAACAADFDQVGCCEPGQAAGHQRGNPAGMHHGQRVAPVGFFQEGDHRYDDQQGFRTFAQQDGQRANKHAHRVVVGAAECILRLDHARLQLFFSLARLGEISGRNSCAVSAHVLFDCGQQRLVPDRQRRLYRLEPVQIGRQRQARGAGLVTLFQRGQTLAQARRGQGQAGAAGLVKGLRAAAQVSQHRGGLLRRQCFRQRGFGRLRQRRKRRECRAQRRVGFPLRGPGCPLLLAERQRGSEKAQRPTVGVAQRGERRHGRARHAAADGLVQREQAAFARAFAVRKSDWRRAELRCKRPVAPALRAVAGRALRLVQRLSLLQAGRLGRRHRHRIGGEQRAGQAAGPLGHVHRRGLVADCSLQRGGLLQQHGFLSPVRQRGELLLGCLREFLHLFIFVRFLHLAVSHGAAVVDGKIVQQLPDLLGAVFGAQASRMSGSG